MAPDAYSTPIQMEVASQLRDTNPSPLFEARSHRAMASLRSDSITMLAIETLEYVLARAHIATVERSLIIHFTPAWSHHGGIAERNALPAGAIVRISRKTSGTSP